MHTCYTIRIKLLFSVNSSCGPMGRDVTSLTIILRALIGPIMFDLDSTIPKIPFNEEVKYS